MKHREFIYVGDPVPEFNEQEHAAFLLNVQKSILLSLEKRYVDIAALFAASRKRTRSITAWRFYI